MCFPYFTTNFRELYFYLEWILSLVGELSISYLYDGSQSGAQVERYVEDDIVRIRLKNTSSIDSSVCLVHPIKYTFPPFHIFFFCKRNENSSSL